MRHDVEERHQVAAYPVSKRLFAVVDGRIRVYSGR